MRKPFFYAQTRAVELCRWRGAQKKFFLLDCLWVQQKNTARNGTVLMVYRAILEWKCALCEILFYPFTKRKDYVIM